MKPKLGDICRVTFWDHAQDADDALLFEIFGRLTDQTKRAYIFHYWRYVSDVDRAADDNKKDNEDRYAIVKSAIETIEVLRCVPQPKTRR